MLLPSETVFPIVGLLSYRASRRTFTREGLQYEDVCTCLENAARISLPPNRRSTSDLQKSRHLQKSRVTERHNRGTKRKLKSHQAQQKALRAFFGAGGATSNFALSLQRVFAFTSVARPEILEFCVAGGHRKFEKFGPSVTSKSKDATVLRMTRLLQVTRTQNLKAPRA